MRILFVHETFGSFGGAEANVFCVAQALKARGHEVGVAARRRSGRAEENWERTFGGNVFFPLLAADWEGVLAKFRPEVVYLHKWDDLSSLQNLISGPAPVIRMVHDHDLYCLRSYRYNPLTRKNCTRAAGPYCVFPCMATIRRTRSGPFPVGLASYSDLMRGLELNRQIGRLIVASGHMKEQLVINGFASDSIAVVPPVPPPAETAPGGFGPENLVLYVGQIVRGKGVDALLRALAQLRQPFEAAILGDGGHRAACRKLSGRLGLDSKVRFPGFVSSDAMHGYYSKASVVAVPSLWPEPFGLVGIEAMRHGLPVVAFDSGGISDWLRDGENGFLVPWNDVTAFADRIDRLLSDKELARRMGRAGLEIAQRDYDFGRYIERLEEIFKTARSGATSGRAA